MDGPLSVRNTRARNAKRRLAHVFLSIIVCFSDPDGPFLNLNRADQATTMERLTPSAVHSVPANSVLSQIVLLLKLAVVALCLIQYFTGINPSPVLLLSVLLAWILSNICSTLSVSWSVSEALFKSLRLISNPTNTVFGKTWFLAKVNPRIRSHH